MPNLIIDLAAFGPGTYTFEDDGIAGNNRSQIRDQNGSIVLVFDHPTTLGDMVIVSSAAGQNVILNFVDDFSKGQFRVGDQFNPSIDPDSIHVGDVVSVESVRRNSRGAITEYGDDAAIDIKGGISILFNAQTGIGTPGNAIEIQADRIDDSFTDSGGIALASIAQSGVSYIGGLHAHSGDGGGTGA